MARAARPRYSGAPTLFQIMRKPQWIGALLLALAVAGGFAWLGRWQLGVAITHQVEKPGESEAVRPLAELTDPGQPVSDHSAGMVVTVQGRFVSGDYVVVDQRTNGGAVGAWVTGHFAVDEADGSTGHLAVAVGWAPSADDAAATIDRLAAAAGSGDVAIEGRYMPADAVVVPKPDEDPQRITSMAPAQLINRWAPFQGPAYGGFLVMHPADPLSAATLADLGLDPIDSVPPLPVETVNWLNLFYAAEWVVFAGFAVYFWYRLTRDAWEKAHELKRLEEREGDAGATPAGGGGSE